MYCTLEEWNRLADLEPDLRLRLEYAADPLAFAELPGVVAPWKQALEGWNVRVFQQILEWQAEAKVDNRRADILRVLEKRCKAPAPGDLVKVIEATKDMDRLGGWLDAAADATSFDDFRAGTQPQR